MPAAPRSATRRCRCSKAMNGLRRSAFLEPEWVAMHPTDYQDIRLLADTAGQFFGGGPFMGAYGNSTPIDANGQITGATDTLWGKPVYVTSAIGGAGTAIVGTREAHRCGRVGACGSSPRIAIPATSPPTSPRSERSAGLPSRCTARTRTSRCGSADPSLARRTRACPPSPGCRRPGLRRHRPRWLGRGGVPPCPAPAAPGDGPGSAGSEPGCAYDSAAGVALEPGVSRWWRR